MSSNEHPNAALIRRALESFNSGAPEEYAQILADDVVWHQIGDRTLNGKEELVASMPDPQAGNSITTKVHDVVANDEHAVGLHKAHAERAGRTLEGNGTLVFHVRDGKVTEVWQYWTDLYAADELFA